MQQKTTEPDHSRFGFKKKAVAAAVLAAIVGMSYSTVAYAHNAPTIRTSADATERKSLTALEVMSQQDTSAQSEGSLTVYTVGEIEQLNAPPPPPPRGYALLAAALAQLGVHQDCTALVENALRALGYSVGDLAPLGFGGYGIQVSPAEVQPGDIMMRGGHVAIYAGDGLAVHGGWDGTTVETSSDSSPYNYAIIIRLI